MCTRLPNRRPSVYIRHLSQWSWCPAESLCETVENPLFILLFQTHGLYSFCCYNVIIYSLCYFNLNCNSLCCYNLIVYSVCRYKFILYFLSFYNLIHSSSLLLQPHHIFLILLQPHPLFLMFLQPNPQFLMLLQHPLLIPYFRTTSSTFTLCCYRAYNLILF